MLQAISITDDDIHFAENILLPVGKTFDDESKDFIRNLNTIDLQAVPGSGKTTALLAKLLIFERTLPFQDGSGILVLSHTNTAINEIKFKIQKHCPKLFSYPNSIGTIQSFVDEFLAIPFYVQQFKKKPIRIDSEIFWEAILQKLPYGSKMALEKRLGNKFKDFIEEAFIKKDSLVHFNTFEELTIPKIGSHTNTYKNLLTVKKELIKKGILNYNDAYSLANIYLKKYTSLKSYLQKRFSYVFVDEMQDMDLHQYEILEKIFYEDGNSLSIFQRIGDKNQAIYNSVKVSDIWNDREVVLRLKGSQRLSKPIANAVSKFALYADDNFEIAGLNECGIKPHILVFDDATINNIIPRFAQIIKNCKENGSLIDSEKYPTKVVAWNTEWQEQADRDNINKLRLVDYYDEFKKDKQKPKQDYVCLKSYLLFYDKTRKTLEPLRKNILNALLKVLRIEKVNCDEGRPYTKKKLIDFIKQNNYIEYERLNLNVYNWSIGIIQGRTNEVWHQLKIYTSEFFGILSTNLLTTSLSFINTDVEDVIIENKTPEITNFYKADGLEIEITSVHAVKGQTHCATLYLETYFQQDGKGVNAKSYESQRLCEQFLGNPIKFGKIGERAKQSTKMAYVGFSRPTNLLCIAIHKNHFNNFLSEINRDEWDIIEVK